MSGRETEIPGFYRDPETGKYYKDVPGGSCNDALKKLKKQNECNKIFNARPKISNVVNFISAREYKTPGCDTKNYLKMRFSLKEETRCIVNDQLNACVDPRIYYLFGSENKMYSAWLGNDSVRHAIVLMDYESTRAQDWVVHYPAGGIIDLCEGISTNEYTVLHRANIFSRNASENDLVSFILTNVPVVSIRNGQGTYMLDDLHSLRRQMYCLSSNKNRQLYAFGCDNLIGFKHEDESVTFLKSKGKVHTMSFDVAGNLLACGVHLGKLFLHDLRAQQLVTTYEVSTLCLVDSFLSDQNIIVGGAGSALCNVDIRMNRIIAEYLNHQQASTQKSPLSIANNMLCARGTDNIIRIWEVSAGGLPIYEIQPHQNPDTNIYGWLCTNGQKTKFHYFEGMTKKVFDIM